MLLEKFSNIIDRSPIGKAVDFRKRLIEETDPNRIYVEKIRSFFHIPRSVAQWLCEEAVREGAFEKRIGVLCPKHEALIGDVGANEELPGKFICQNCQIEGEEKFEYLASECKKIEFFKLVKDG